MDVFIVLWSCLFTTKLSCLQKNNLGHTNQSVHATTKNRFSLYLFSEKPDEDQTRPQWDSKLVNRVSELEVESKIQQTKMLVMGQRFGDLFLFGLVWQYSSVQTKYNKGRFKVMATYLQQLYNFEPTFIQ